MNAIHEGQGATEVKMGSERSFGVVFCVVFLVIALWPVFGDGTVRLWALAVAAAFLTVAIAAPRLLAPLNVLWFKFGILLHHVVTPVVMGLIFFVAVVPTGLVMQALGKDAMRLRPDRSADSYWIARSPPGPDGKSMKYQF